MTWLHYLINNPEALQSYLGYLNDRRKSYTEGFLIEAQNGQHSVDKLLGQCNVIDEMLSFIKNSSSSVKRKQKNAMVEED